MERRVDGSWLPSSILCGPPWVGHPHPEDVELALAPKDRLAPAEPDVEAWSPMCATPAGAYASLEAHGVRIAALASGRVRRGLLRSACGGYGGMVAKY